MTEMATAEDAVTEAVVMDTEEESEDLPGKDAAELPETEDSSQRKKGRPVKPPQYPCLCCGENCGTRQHTVQCSICNLWAHKDCIRMSDTTYKTLLTQKKEMGRSYWLCSPCRTFGGGVKNQFQECNQRITENEKRIEENARRTDRTENRIEALAREMKRLEERLEKQREEKADELCDEMQEREVRRMNLIIHGVEEQPEDIRNNRDRMEADKRKCEEIFNTMRAKTTAGDLRFCRRIGERGENPRPLLIGLENEEQKRHILARARDLQGSRYQNVSIVPDLTKKQRNLEAKLVTEAERRNNEELTQEERNRNMKWLVVGRRGEKRLIKGVEREQRGNYENNRTSRGNDWTRTNSVRLIGGINNGSNNGNGSSNGSGGNNGSNNSSNNGSNGNGNGHGSGNNRPNVNSSSNSFGNGRNCSSSNNEGGYRYGAEINNGYGFSGSNGAIYGGNSGGSSNNNSNGNGYRPSFQNLDYRGSNSGNNNYNNGGYGGARERMNETQENSRPREQDRQEYRTTTARNGNNRYIPTTNGSNGNNKRGPESWEEEEEREMRRFRFQPYYT